MTRVAGSPDADRETSTPVFKPRNDARSLDLNDLRLLLQVIEHGSYTAAFRASGVPKSTISQRMAALERTVGTGLLRRTSRSLSLTAAGSELLPYARAIEDLARQVERTLIDRDTELGGTLRVSCSSALAQFALSAIVPRFLRNHARAAIRVEANNRPVDLVGKGFDMTILDQVAPLKDSTLRQRVVARTPWLAVASSDWIATWGMPAEPAALTAGAALCFATTPRCPGWTFRRDHDEQTVHPAARLISDDMVTLRASAIAGAGVACLPSYLLRSPLDRGDLVRILPEWSLHTSRVSVLTPPRAQSSRLAGAFSDFLAVELPRVMP